jgi:hypothetical protein
MSLAWRLRCGIALLLAILFILMGAQVSGLGYMQTGRLSAPEAHAATNLSCTAGSFYTLTAGDGGNGTTNNRYARIYGATANLSSGTINAAVSAVGQATGNSWGWNSMSQSTGGYYFNNSTYGFGVNGLAIGSSGTVAYAFDRFATAQISGNNVTWTNNRVAILKYDPSTGTNGTYSTALSSYTLPNGSAAYMVAGAVNPVNGKYYFGGYGGSPANRFFLYAYDPTTNAVSQVGYHDVTQVNSQGGNGDIAFDASGNMSIIYSSSSRDSNKYNKIITFAAQTIANGSGNNALTSASSVLLTETTTDINGIAYDSTGYLYIQAVGQVARYDPNTGVASGWTTLTGFSGNSSTSDLGSCLTPGTLTVQKVVNGRVASGDQFTMSVVRTDAPSTNLSTATTTGSATGLQSVTTPPVIGVVGQKYTVSESGSGAADSALSRYSSTYSCTWTDGNGVVQSNSGSGRSFILMFPAAATGAARGIDVTCTFTNTPPNGTLRWAKGNALNTMLPGSEWSLVGPGAVGSSGSISRTVTDCVGGTAAACTSYDQNFQMGIFEVDNLLWGSYTLTETKAPSGYALDSTVHTFTIGTDSLVKDFGTIINKQVAGSATWQKVDAASTSTLLSGSQWALWQPASGSTCTTAAGSNAITVADNGTNDTNSTAGAMTATGLAWGAWCLKETVAPVGFVLSSTVRTFTISASNLNQDFTSDTDAPFADVRQTVPTLPLTGGMSADAFLLAGAGFLALACAFGIVVALRRRGSARRH